MSKMQDLKKWIKSFYSGRTWLMKLVSKYTIDTYLPNLKRYCEACGKNPDELIAFKDKGIIDFVKTGNPALRFQAEELFDITISEMELTESARSNISTAVISFYKHNRRPLVEVKKFERPEAEKRRPSIEDVEAMANSVGWKRDKALIWFLSSACFREGTLVKLTWGDLKLTEDVEAPIMITIKGARMKGAGKGRYKGIEQTCFLHKSAWELMLAYKKEATRKLRKKYSEFEITDKTPLFLNYVNGKFAKGLTTFGFSEVWTKASLNAWGDLEVKRFSPHDMRDFVSNALKKAKVDVVDRAVLTGHKIKGVERHYQDPEKMYLKEAFKSAIPFLTPQKPEQLRKDIDTQKDRIEELEEISKTYRERMLELEGMIPTGEEITRLKTILKEIKESE